MSLKHTPLIVCAAILTIAFFAAGSFAGEGRDQISSTGGVAWWSLIKPLGITTIVLLVLTAGLGFFRKFKPRTMLRVHKVVALLTLIAALSHAGLVIFLSGAPSGNVGDTSAKLHETKCSRCHNHRRDWDDGLAPAFWKRTVSRMRSKDPGWISEKEAGTILEYILKTAKIGTEEHHQDEGH